MKSGSAARHILIAEHAPRAISHTLTRSDWQVDCCLLKSGLAEAMAGHVYDVVVVDYVLPDIDSAGLQRVLSARQPQPALILVGQGEPADEVGALLRESAAACLEPPLAFRELEVTIERIFKRQSQQQAYELWQKALVDTTAEYHLRSWQLTNLRYSLPIFDKLERAGRLRPDIRLKLELAFQEALANALDHGNLELDSELKESAAAGGNDAYLQLKCERLQDKQYRDRLIVVRVHYNGARLEIGIKDSGRGFLSPEQADSEKILDHLACHGRGLKLIQESVDEVCFGCRGSEIIMIKNL